MKLRNEFAVAVPLATTWSALLDVPRVARALPGATIEPDGVAGSYRGSMKVRLGPVRSEYVGTAELQEADEDEHVATFRLTGREARGPGTASATIRNRLAPARGRTQVIVETDLHVTGRAAQLGPGIIEDVAVRLLADFAVRLEQEVLAPAEGAPGPGARERGEALDLGAAIWRSVLARPAALAGAAALGLLAGYLLGRRRGAVGARGRA